MVSKQSFLFIVLTLAGLAPTGTAAAPRINCFSNGGFENGLTDWSADAHHELETSAAAAHSGHTCLTGEVTKPNQALRLRRDVPVHAGNRYDFTVWARGTLGTKIVLWVVRPGTDQRESVATWSKLARAWRPCQATWIAKKTGVLHFELICPSSFGAVPGRIWIDDLTLYETEMPPAVAVSADAGFCDEPTMALAHDGSIYAAYNQFQHESDSLQLVHLSWPAGQASKVLNRWSIPGAPKSYILGPQLVSSGNTVTLVYAAEVERNWDIYCVACGPDGPGTPLRITCDPGVDTDPRAAWHDGRLWVTWESNRDRYRSICVTSVQDGDVAAPQRLSQPAISSYDPAVAVTAHGDVAVAWHAFQENNYDVYFSRRGTDGAWGQPVRLTRAPTIDRHAFLFTAENRFYIVYENAAIQQYHIGATNQRHLIVAQIGEHGLRAPKTRGRSPLDGRCEAANVQFDRHGRLWLTMLRPRLPRSGWDAFLTCFRDGQWRQLMPLSNSKGMDRQPAMAVQDDHMFAVLQGDDIPQSWSDVDKTGLAKSNIYAVRVDTSQIHGDAAIEWVPLVEPATPFEAAAIRVERGEDDATPSIQYQGQTLRLYYGDLHEHSDISVCNRVGDQSLDESYQHMRDLARYDFVCITDHGYNMSPYLWNYSAKLARVNDDPGRYLTFLGQEWTSTFEEYPPEHPYGFYGHRNLILADLYFPKWWNARNRQTPQQVWDDLHDMHANFIHIPHQLADTGNVPTDWSFHNEVTQPVAEIFQTRGSYEYRGAPRQAARAVPKPGYFLQDAWALGIVIGVIASPDHGGGYGKACVYAPELTREAILDALRARHCFGTTAAKIQLDVRVNGHLMGEKIAQPATEPVTVTIRVRCPQPIERVEICRSNQFIHRVEPKGNVADITFVDRKPLLGTSYYYARVIQRDQEIAWSSPVWFGATDEISSRGHESHPRELEAETNHP